MQGLTLVEMMVAMVLGLVVIGGAISLTLANRQSHRTNEGLSQVQESARTAFELIARDLRQAGVTGCDNEGRVANVLDATGGEWWVQWFGGLMGHDGDSDTSAVPFGTSRGARIAGTDALQVQGLQGVPFSIESHNTGTATIRTTAVTDIAVGDVLIACDFEQAAIFQATAVNASGQEIVHGNTGGSPGNCSTGLAHPTTCGSAAGNAKAFPRNSMLGRFLAVDWYVGASDPADDRGRSLFRRRVTAAGEVTEEVVAGVTGLTLRFRVDGSDDFEPAGDIADWDEVNAVRVEIEVQSADARVSTDPDNNDGRIVRERLSQIITLRNRVP
jgi:type IV pilus assembly protein PilW